jgi:hypothetical protein
MPWYEFELVEKLRDGLANLVSRAKLDLFRRVSSIQR